MKFAVVTTFNQAGYESYGRRMIETFLANWPAEVDLWVYAEDCVVPITAPNLHVLDLNQSCPGLVLFKKQWKNVPYANGDVTNDPVRSLRKDAGKGFKWNAVRFAHKVYSIFHCARSISTDWLIWMDADTVCHSAITVADLDRLCPPGRDLCFLGRRGKYSECGLYAINLAKTDTKTFLQKFQRMYDDAEDGIFTLDEWHDSYVFDAVRKQCNLKELDWSSHLITGEGHPLINSEWGAYLDHLKGDRKDQGRSRARDLKVTRTEAYWL
jgi:hypothetical protein